MCYNQNLLAIHETLNQFPTQLNGLVFPNFRLVLSEVEVRGFPKGMRVTLLHGI